MYLTAFQIFLISVVIPFIVSACMTILYMKYLDYKFKKKSSGKKWRPSHMTDEEFAAYEARMMSYLNNNRESK